jgi:oligopeptidase A
MNHPFLAPEFHVSWSNLHFSNIERDITHALERARRNIEIICIQNLEQANFESTFLAIEEATKELDRGWVRLNHLNSVSDTPEQREAFDKMLPIVTDFYSSIELNERLWNVIKTVSERPETGELGSITERFIHETLANFRNAGADLPLEKRKRLAVIESEIAKLTSKYSENIFDSKNAWELVITDASKLAGLPKSAKTAAAFSARAKGLTAPAWRFTLQFPSMSAVMQYLNDDDIRKQVWMAFCKIGTGETWDNSSLVWKILSLRQEKAKIIGYKSFADLKTSRWMAKDGQTALKFVDKLLYRTCPKYFKEYEDLAEFKAERTGEPAKLLEPWEVAFWSEMQRKENFDYDEEQLRPYFSLDGVLSGMFEIARQLFGITIRELKTGSVETWHPECKFYELHDLETTTHLGSFYTDWHPRESKISAPGWANILQYGSPGEPHLGIIAGNLSPLLEGGPTLLTYREVLIVFHEFGHMLHALLSETSFKTLSGFSVPCDFVELPSQFMENFCWNRESLDLFARHFETGETIPDELFDKLIAAKRHFSANSFIRLLLLAKVDIELHTRSVDFLDRNLDDLERELLEGNLAPLKTEPPSRMCNAEILFGDFSHYAAGVYSYKWSEMLDADVFTRFQKEGILNARTGRLFRETILSKGNLVSVEELYRRFMARDPELKPLLIRENLIVH